MKHVVTETINFKVDIEVNAISERAALEMVKRELIRTNLSSELIDDRHITFNLNAHEWDTVMDESQVKFKKVPV